jgi:hypothetical protein
MENKPVARIVFDQFARREWCWKSTIIVWRSSLRHPEARVARATKDADHPLGLAELGVGPAASGRTHWLAPQGDEKNPI